MDYTDFTPTQQAMLRILADGNPHTKQELHKCLNDELQSLTSVKVHVSNIRKVLRLTGQDIACEMVNRATYYRQVRLVGSSYRE
jgi:DNA-binding CsgD family transcriptional regulator